ncbi:PaaI family thioesterase [Hyalangium sp.]|uniref:PaaI family thioesterase n=1 Tax=Hyalangium sp. TaxID=2028555 RepID=UPI002D70861F|nr:PaaI family thioesterase [Hyalangium sp.]HYI00986.1 PaaI family thioesterase [Hyalangium sp.]
MDDKLKERLGRFGQGGYDRSLTGMELLEASGGKARVRLPVGEAVQNLNGVLHGGAVATLVDVVGTLAIMSADRDHRPGVSTDLNVSWLAPAPGGSTVLVEASVLKSGRTLAFVQVDIRRENDGVMVAQGRMTKFLS